MIREMIALASNGARNKALNVVISDWEQVLRLAQEHNVVTLVACAVANMPGEVCPVHIQEYLLGLLRYTCTTSLIRKQRVLYLLEAMKAEGIEPKILKGYSVARYYSSPESRVAVDTDILVPTSQEKKVYDFFCSRGFEILERNPTSHHGICQHKKYGKFEIHVKLYDEIVNDVWFHQMQEDDHVGENTEYVNSDGVSFAVLGPTDQLLFLTLHMVKHFISDGITFGMMLDLALSFEHTQDVIDVKRYWSTLEKLRYDSFVSTVYAIMIKYGGFCRESFKGVRTCSEESMNLLLLDLHRGGYMGKNDSEERQKVRMEYNKCVIRQTKSRTGYLLYMLKWKIRSARKHMFLSYANIRELYPVTQKNILILPLAWLYQAARYPLTKIRKGVLKRDIRLGESELGATSQMRLELFRHFNMI